MKTLLFVAALSLFGAGAYAEDAVIVHHDPAPGVVVEHRDPPVVVEHRSDSARDCSSTTVRKEDDATGSSTTVKKNDCN